MFARKALGKKNRGFYKVGSYLFLVAAVVFMLAMNSAIGMAAMLIICTVPLLPSSIDTLAIVLLSGASTTFTKS